MTELPKPYYQDDAVTIYHGDCESIVPALGKFDAIITDPPYGVDGAILNPNRNKRVRSHNDWHETPKWDKEIKPEWCSMACNASDVILWFGNWKRREAVASSMAHPIRAEIIWAKDTHVGPPCPLAMQDERIWIFSKAGFNARVFETTVWKEKIIPSWSHRRHKNEKPTSIMRRLLRLSTNEGDTVLDPFAGSGTTGFAAKLEGRNAVLIELSESHCETAARRLSQGVLF